jgi:glycosyltransferase involved in cell wall biosynthesis
MKIAIIISPCIEVPVKSYGGMEQVAYLLARELGKTNEVTVFAAKGSKVENCEVVETIEPGYSTPYENRELTQWNSIKDKLYDFDIIDFHWHSVPPIHGRRIFWSIHDYKPSTPLYQGNFIARSKSHAEFLEKYWGWEVNYCYNPVDISRFKIAKKEDFFLFLSRIDQMKGAHNFVEIAKSFPEQKFVMAGMDDINKGIDPFFLANIFRELPKNCEYLGEVSEEEKIDLLARAKALICPYGNYSNGEPYFEVFGIHLIESLASGTPIFTLVRHGSPEELIPKNCGVIANSLEELKKALKDFIEGKVGFEPIKLREKAEEFSPERVTTKYINIYSQISNNEVDKKRN